MRNDFLADSCSGRRITGHDGTPTALAYKPGHGIGRDLLHGALAGVAGTWALDRVDWFLYRREPITSRLQTWMVRPGGEDPGHVLARRIEAATGAELDQRQHHIAGQTVHYLGGVLPAALYGALRARLPALGAGRGTAYGLAGFVGDLVGSPAAGLAASPRRYPWRVHARSLAAHLVYGIVTEAVWRALDSRAGRRA